MVTKLCRNHSSIPMVIQKLTAFRPSSRKVWLYQGLNSLFLGFIWKTFKTFKSEDRSENAYVDLTFERMIPICIVKLLKVFPCLPSPFEQKTYYCFCSIPCSLSKTIWTHTLSFSDRFISGYLFCRK